MLNFVFSYFNHYSFNLVAQWVRQLDYLTTHTSLSPIRHGFAPGFVNYKKWCTWLAVASEKVYQLLAHGRWFSPASSTTKTGRHDIAEILLKVALSTINQIKSTFNLWKRLSLQSSYWEALEDHMSILDLFLMILQLPFKRLSFIMHWIKSSTIKPHHVTMSITKWV